MKKIKEKNYYLLPITSDKFTLNGTKFSDMFSITYPMLYDLELEKEDLINKHSHMDHDKLEHTQNRIFNLYNEINIPHYIIAVGENDKLYELITRANIEKCEELSLLQYSSSYETVNNYFNKNSYPYRFANYYGDYIMSNMDCLEQKKRLFR